MASEIQSPAPFVLSPNNDQLERAQVSAARAAAYRRKATTVTGLASPPMDPCLSEEQVAELFHRCIKLASENVTRVEVQYDRTSKRIDLHALKKTLWDQMQEFVKGPEPGLKDAISFKGILSTFPVNCQAAMPEDISPHLCFICLLFG